MSVGDVSASHRAIHFWEKEGTTDAGPHSDEALRGLDGYEQMVDTFAQNAKTYWRLWGPLGEPMVRVVEAWVEQQRAYVQWLRENYEAEKRP